MTFLSNALAYLFAALMGIVAVSMPMRSDYTRSEVLERCPKPWLIILYSIICGLIGYMLVIHLLLRIKILDPFGFLAGLGGAFILSRVVYDIIECPEPLRRKR